MQFSCRRFHLIMFLSLIALQLCHLKLQAEKTDRSSSYFSSDSSDSSSDSDSDSDSDMDSDGGGDSDRDSDGDGDGDGDNNVITEDELREEYEQYANEWNARYHNNY